MTIVETSSHLHAPRRPVGSALGALGEDLAPYITVLEPAALNTCVRGVDMVAVERAVNGTVNPATLTPAEKDRAFWIMWETAIPEKIMAKRLGTVPRQIGRRKNAILYGAEKTYWENTGPRRWEKVTRIVKYGPLRGVPPPFPYVTTRPYGPVNITIRRGDGTKDVVPVNNLRARNPYPAPRRP